MVLLTYSRQVSGSYDSFYQRSPETSRAQLGQNTSMTCGFAKEIEVCCALTCGSVLVSNFQWDVAWYPGDGSGMGAAFHTPTSIAAGTFFALLQGEVHSFHNPPQKFSS